MILLESNFDTHTHAHNAGECLCEYNYNIVQRVCVSVLVLFMRQTVNVPFERLHTIDV